MPGGHGTTLPAPELVPWPMQSMTPCEGKPSRSKTLSPLEQNCFHSCIPAHPSLSVLRLINSRACTVFFFGGRKKNRKNSRKECNFLKRPLPPQGSTGLQPRGWLPPPSAPAGHRRWPSSPAHRCGLPPGPWRCAGKGQTCRGPFAALPRTSSPPPPAGASPTPRITSPTLHIPGVAAPRGWEVLHPPLHLSSVGRIPGK